MTVAEFNGVAIDDADAGVVELVDAPDSKSGSARSVGSIPTTRTIHLPVRVLRTTRPRFSASAVRGERAAKGPVGPRVSLHVNAQHALERCLLNVVISR